MTRALIGTEGGVPPILLWLRYGRRWGVYLRTRRWRVTAGPMYGWRACRVAEGPEDPQAGGCGDLRVSGKG